ncbi:MAG: prolipoprotein diacylglyceryl transferase [Chlamydiae bacterium]|nr:prolipoprotein diacylglyceryl transferase [Chlamydiota bacterium]
MILHIFVDPPRVAFTIPFIDYPIAWYGILFALGFGLGLRALKFACDWRPFSPFSGEEIATKITNFLIVGIVLGARLFHLFFYESLNWLLEDPLRPFRFWEGGLASHGGIICSFLTCYLFVFVYRLPFFKLLDRIFPCGMILGGFIRLGNFMNQEILGLKTDLPWGMVFQTPQAFSSYGLYPRHPVQIYESLFYFSLALIGFALLKNRSKTAVVASVLGLLMSIGRFFVEFLKEDQSIYTLGFTLNMGQLLSIPLIVMFAFSLFFALNNKIKEPFSQRIS